MQDIYFKTLALAKLDSPIIIAGETGVEKKRLAYTIHKNSSRNIYPFNTFCCLDIDEERYRDAFWGQMNFVNGMLTLQYDVLEKAERGTLFLDYFSDLTVDFRNKVITSYLKGCQQVFKYSPESAPRLILSISLESYNNILSTNTGQRLLRNLNPFFVLLPPLRERKEDIPKLVSQILYDMKVKNKDWSELDISSEALDKYIEYSWPGNMRQLRNALFYGATLAQGKTITSSHLPLCLN